MRAIILCFLIAVTSSCSEATVSGAEDNNPVKIKNTASFITYFSGIQNMLSFGKIRDSIYVDVRAIKKNTGISEADKTILKEYYNAVQAKTESMYNQIVADLLDKEKRKEIKNNVEGYIQNINIQFEGIKKSGRAFTDKYIQVSGQKRGFFIAWILKAFLLPLAKEFVNEAINGLIKQQLDKYLKPKLVFQSWDSL